MAVASTDYEAFLAQGDPGLRVGAARRRVAVDRAQLHLGHTGDPKGVVYHHRGAYLNAMGNALAFGLTPDTAYLWTLPMFHCNGWTYTWAVTLVGGTHVCLRQVDPARIFELIGRERVTHLCAAPIVLNMLIHSPAKPPRPYAHRVEVATGGAAPPSTVIEQMEGMGFKVTHLYGLTETYGPATLVRVAARLGRPGPDRPRGQDGAPGRGDADAAGGHGDRPGDRTARAGRRHDGRRDRDSRQHRDEGYLENLKATDEAFKGGWFRSGDLAVLHGDGYIEIKDRLKDIIISGGRIFHARSRGGPVPPSEGLRGAVVAKPDEKWGETPCAFVTPQAGRDRRDGRGIITWCRANLAAFKCPKHVVFGELPKTSTGKIQKFCCASRPCPSGQPEQTHGRPYRMHVQGRWPARAGHRRVQRARASASRGTLAMAGAS
jgi:fatty-acyl-CoA synthase